MALSARSVYPLMVFFLIGLAIPCMGTGADDGAASRPSHPPELQILDQWRGFWDVVARRRVPQPATITYTDRYDWVLDGRFIRGQAGPKSDGSTSMSMATYDPHMQAYRFWSYDSSGLALELIPAHWNDKTRTMEWDGGLFSLVSITGRVQFVDDDTIRWSSVLKDWKGTVCESAPKRDPLRNRNRGKRPGGQGGAQRVLTRSGR